MNSKRHLWWWVNTDPDNGLVPSVTKPLPEPMLTKFHDIIYRADSSFAPSRWETALLCNNVSYWLGTSLESALIWCHKGPINNIPALVQIMAWCRSGNKPLSEPMLIILLAHICITRLQWVNQHWVMVMTVIHTVLSHHLDPRWWSSRAETTHRHTGISPIQRLRYVSRYALRTIRYDTVRYRCSTCQS